MDLQILFCTLFIENEQVEDTLSKNVSNGLPLDLNTHVNPIEDIEILLN